MPRFSCATTAPVSHRGWNDRRHLRALQAAVADHRFTLVHAPAGYGKTALLADWHRSLSAAGHPTIWLSARAGLSSASALLAALAQAIGADADLDAILAQLAPDAGGRHPILFVDDAHWLDEAARRLLVDLADRARGQLSVAIASRGRRAMPLARMALYGRALVVGPDQLRLSLREGLAFLARHLGRPIDAKQGAALIAATDGWPAGLAFVADALAGGDPDPLQGSLPALLNDYFDEEVLADLKPDQRRVLDALAVLEPDAAASWPAMLDEDADLAVLLDQGVFVSADQANGTPRLHALFRAALRRRLSAKPAGWRDLQTRASAACSAKDDPLGAVRHAGDSGDALLLADVLERHAEELTYRSHLATVVDIAETLPPVLRATRPSILLAMAWRRARQLDFATAERLLAEAERAIDALGDDRDVERLRQLARHRRIVLAAGRDDLPVVERDSDALLREIGDANPYLACNLLAMKMIARRELYHYQDAMRLEAETRVALARPGAGFAAIAFKASVAPNLIAQGRLDAAELLLSEALAAAETAAAADPGVAALAALPLAELCYERGELDRAAELHRRHIAHARDWGFADQILSGDIVGARLAMAEGRSSDALALLHEAHLVAIACDVPRLVAGIVAERVRCLLADGQVVAAERLAFATGFPRSEAELMPTRAAARLDELGATTWIRLEIRRGRLAGARKVARAWRDFLARHEALRSLIVFELLLVQIAFLEGDASEARRLLRAAIAQAAPAGFTRLFIDEGEIVTSLIEDAYRDDLRFGGPTDAFAMRLLDSVSPRAAVVRLEAEAAATEQLARRECEILALVDAGFRNREIGARLGLTEGTVKWYMQQIYDKLGVRRRPQAVIRARQLGMMR